MPTGRRRGVKVLIVKRPPGAAPADQPARAGATVRRPAVPRSRLFLGAAPQSAGRAAPVSARRNAPKRRRYCAGVSPVLRWNRRPKKLASW